MGVFHAYDIRGLWGEINAAFAHKLGRVMARLFRPSSVMLGYDARLYSEELYRELAAGFCSEGVPVTGIGLCSTPQLHFSQFQGKFELGIMVTASHNPKDYHGFKVFDKRGGSISFNKGLDRVEQEMKKDLPQSNLTKSSFKEQESLQPYIDFLVARAERLEFSQPIIIDVANGSAGVVFKALADRLNLKVIFLNFEPDGNFPAHEPNPLKDDSRRQIGEALKKSEAAFGTILDGDGDRIIFVDEKGQAIENYFTAALISRQLLKSFKGAAIVYDLISSKVLPEEIKAAQGLPIVSRVGYTFLYDKMVEHKAVFGAETSGHVYFKVDDTYYTESAAYALIMLLKLLSFKAQKLSALLEPLRSRYYQAPELNIKTKAKEKALQLVRDYFKDGKFSELDGVSVEYDDFWFNIRPSNTEPFLRVRLEALNMEVGEQKLKLLKDLLSSLES